MSDLFANQVVVITGAGRGIGAAAARLFAIHGASVVVNDLDPEPAESVAEDINSAGGTAIAFPGSITGPGFPEQLLQAAVDQFGKINILVNNAGFTWDAMLHKMSDEQWQAIQDVHGNAPFRMIRAAARHMREPAKAEKKAGGPIEPRCIINVSSTSGLHGNIGQANYAHAKMGLVGLTKTVAKEWGFLGIRCNTVAFGFIDTRLTRPKEAGDTIRVGDRDVALGIPAQIREMASSSIRIPLGRAGTPDEAAGGILLLASPFASYITGHVLEVTGGAGI